MKRLRKISLSSLFFICLLLFGFFAAAHAAQFGIVATAAPDYSSGAHSVISVEPENGSRTVQNELDPSGSDLRVVAQGEYFYRLERSNAHNVTKYNVNNPETVIWQYSTEGAESGSNPYDIVFVDSEKAYLLRYGSEKAWIINPSAETEDGFKTGELDLSAYSDADNLPDMHSGLILGDRLFIILQRVDYSNYPNTDYNASYVAVFDTTTDTEIDTGSASALKGIEIPTVKNLLGIQYLDKNDMIYVQGVGDYDASTQSTAGGIVRIDPDTYQTEVVLTDNPAYGAVSGMSIISEAKGYFVGYAGWGDNTLYSFDPASGAGIEPVSGLENKSIAGMEGGVYTDQNEMLWICNQTDARIDILDTTDDTIDASVSTALNPLNVAFAESSPSRNTDDDDSSDSGCFISTLK